MWQLWRLRCRAVCQCSSPESEVYARTHKLLTTAAYRRCLGAARISGHPSVEMKAEIGFAMGMHFGHEYSSYASISSAALMIGSFGRRVYNHARLPVTKTTYPPIE